MNALERAIVIAAKAHDGQFDRQGEHYILHPLRVMLAGTTEAERVVGVLHDVVEDTPVSLLNLDEEGFAWEIVEAVRALTHTDDEPYEEYIDRVAENPLARTVKIADLKDNMARKDGLGRAARERLMGRYTAALAKLEGKELGYAALKVQVEGADVIAPAPGEETPPATCSTEQWADCGCVAPDRRGVDNGAQGG